MNSEQKERTQRRRHMIYLLSILHHSNTAVTNEPAGVIVKHETVLTFITYWSASKSKNDQPNQFLFILKMISNGLDGQAKRCWQKKETAKHEWYIRTKVRVNSWTYTSKYVRCAQLSILFKCPEVYCVNRNASLKVFRLFRWRVCMSERTNAHFYRYICFCCCFFVIDFRAAFSLSLTLLCDCVLLYRRLSASEQKQLAEVLLCIQIAVLVTGYVIRKRNTEKNHTTNEW